MYRNLTVSVVMPAYNEEEFIFHAVRDFLSIPEVDEVVVVDNNSKDKTKELAESAGARVIVETKQGYGHASKTALMSATGDIVLIVEPDGTFRAKDIYKFLSYAEEFDAVIGTRTAKSCIWGGANMGWFLRYGNVAVAKLLEYLHNGPCFTDVGCTFKMIRRSVLQQIEPLLTVGKSHFSPQLMTVLVRTGMRCIEIPVHYRSRLGVSKITGSFWKAFRLGWKMIFMILGYRFRRLPQLQSGVSKETLIDIGEHREEEKPRKASAPSEAPAKA
ncbi:MAG: glycosyltransferase family 2 protein [Phycisphaeraceae bacterium]